jgi:hypothetical protein
LVNTLPWPLRFANSAPAVIRIGQQVAIGRGHFYKYKPLVGSAFEHVCEILSDSKIFFPRPSQLNDPEECKPSMTIGDIGDPQYRPSVDAWVRRCITHREPQPSEEEIQAELAQLTQEQLEGLLKDVDIEYRAAVENRYRILSLSNSPRNHHLWRKYAAEYNGVCLEFHVNSNFGTAL